MSGPEIQSQVETGASTQVAPVIDLDSYRAQHRPRGIDTPIHYRLVERAQAGDSYAEGQLCVAATPLMASLVRKAEYKRPTADSIQDAQVTNIKSIREFDTTQKEIRLSSF